MPTYLKPNEQTHKWEVLQDIIIIMIIPYHQNNFSNVKKKKIGFLYSSSWENSMKIATLAKMLLTVIFIFSVRYVPVNLSLLLVENPSERSMCAPEQTSRDRLGPFTLPVHQSTKPGQGSGQTGAHSWKKSNTEKKADCATCQLGAWEHEGGSYVNSLRFCQPIGLFHIIVLTRIEV